MIRILIFLLTLSQATQANELALGRLFYTPAQRARLDAMRQQVTVVGLSDEAYFTFNGVVRRSSGKDTHWINGQSQAGRPVPGQRPGQIINRHTGEVVSPLDGGIIQIHPAGR